MGVYSECQMVNWLKGISYEDMKESRGKTMAVKKTVTKETVAAKTEEKATVKAAAAKKPVVKEEVAVKEEDAVKEEKPAEKKNVKKPAAKKAAVKENVYVQCMGIEVSTDDIMKKVKENWTKVLKNKVADMNSVTVYIKPEEGKAYFVINDDVTGSVEL